MKDFYEGLSDKEKEELKKAHDKHVEQEEVMQELQKTDPKLFEKANKLWQEYKASIAKLNPEAKEFADEVRFWGQLTFGTGSAVLFSVPFFVLY